MQCFCHSTEGYAELGVKDVDAAFTEMDELAKKMLPSVELYPDAHKRFYDLDELKSPHPTYIVRYFRDIIGFIL